MSSGRKQLWMMGGALAAAVALCGTGMVSAYPAVSRDSSAKFSEILLDPSVGLFTPAGLDAKSAERFKQAAVASRGKYLFTPAGVSQARNRTVTVAVRAGNDEAPRAVSVRNVIAASEAGTRTTASIKSLESVKPTKYELGSATGWTSFAVPTESRKSNAPAIGQISSGAGYTLDDEPQGKRSKFNTRVTLESPNAKGLQRRVGGANEYALDVGGSYSITKGVDVTAGLRVESEQEAPIVSEQRDSQAVYLGTLIRF